MLLRVCRVEVQGLRIVVAGAGEMTNWEPKVGDFCTRDGSDIHKILEITGFESAELLCVKEPAIREGETKPWTTIGEIEHNLLGRYSPVDYQYPPPPNP